jgi:hypothetical protein
MEVIRLMPNDDSGRFVHVHTGDAKVVLDLDRLRPAERRLWDETFADGFPGEDSPAIALYGFAHICNLMAYGFPAVVTEWMDALAVPPAYITGYLNRLRRQVHETERYAED